MADRYSIPDKPTREWVFAELERRRRIYGTWRREVENVEEFIDATSIMADQTLRQYMRGLPIDPNYRIEVGPIIVDSVNVGRNQIMNGQTPSVTVIFPAGTYKDTEKEDEQTHKQEIQDYCEGWLRHNEKRTETPLLGLVEDALGRGLGTWAYPYSAPPEPPFGWQDEAKTKPKEGNGAKDRATLRRWRSAKSQHNAWDVRAVSPLGVFPDPHHDPIQDMIEVQPANRSSYRHLFPEYSGGADDEGSSMEVIIYCSDAWYGCWLGDAPLLTAADGADEDGIAPNKMERLWYKIGPGGWGRRNHKGEFVHWWKGVLADGRVALLRYLVVQQQIDSIVQMHAFPVIKATGPPNEGGTEIAERVAETLTSGPAAIWAFRGDVEVEFVQPPPIPPALLQKLEDAKVDIERHFGPAVLTGVREPGETASGQRGRTDKASAIYGPCKQSCESVVEGALEDMLYAIREELIEPVPVATIGGMSTLKAERVIEGLQLVVDFAPATKQDRLMDLQALMMMHEQGLASMLRVLENDPDVTDVDREMALILSDKIELSALALEEAARQQMAEQQAAMSPPATGAGPEQAQQALPPPGTEPTLPGEQPGPAGAGSIQDMMQQEAVPPPVMNGARMM